MITPIRVLLVEDNPADADLARETLAQSKLLVKLSVVPDGEKALEYLRQENEFSYTPIPDIVLLDLNLPKKDGREVLADIKRDAALRRIPVVVLTSSANEADVSEMYSLGANSYVTKPVDLKAFREIVNSLVDYWFTVVRLPTAVAGNLGTMDN